MSLPPWTAGQRVAHAFSGLKTGDADFEQLDAAVTAANTDREREQDEESQR